MSEVETDVSEVIVRDLSKRYGEVKALDGVGFEIKTEICGVLGVNGAGKSTLFKLLAGVIEPDHGHITINGYDLRTHPYDARKAIGYLPEDFYAYERLTGGEFLEFIASLREAPAPGPIIEELLRYFGMFEARSNLIKSYSFGMIKRIGLIASILGDPRLLILDEPLGALDIRTVYLLRKKLMGLHQEGTTILISSHVISFIERLATRILIVHGGQIVANGSAGDLKRMCSLDDTAPLEDAFFNLVGLTSVLEGSQPM